MSRAVNAVVIGIAVFILLAGSFWYLSVAQGTEKLAVESHLSVQSADESNTRLLAELTFKNRHDVDVRLHSFAYEFRVDDLSLANNASKERIDLKPREESQKSIILSFPTDFVSEWLKNHVEAGEKSIVYFSGNATFQVGSRNQTVEFEDKRDFSTSIRASLEKAENCPRASPEPCVEGAMATWREREQTRVLELALRVKNSAQEEVKIDRPRAALTWAGVEVAKAEATGIILEGAATEPIEFDLFLDHTKLKEWWPKHLDDCEKSPVALSVTFAYEVQPEDENTTSPSPTTVSSAPTFTPTNSTSATASNTTTTTSSPSPTTTSPSPSATSPSPTPTNTSSSASPTNETAGFPTVQMHHVTYVFLFDDVTAQQPEDPEPRSGSWDLEGDEVRTSFVCEDPDALLDLP